MTTKAQLRNRTRKAKEQFGSRFMAEGNRVQVRKCAARKRTETDVQSSAILRRWLDEWAINVQMNKDWHSDDEYNGWNGFIKLEKEMLETQIDMCDIKDLATFIANKEAEKILEHIKELSRQLPESEGLKIAVRELEAIVRR